MKPYQFQNLGIIADSHGKSEIISKAIRFLKTHKCHDVFHLGDICDSFRPETCDSCIQVLKKNGVVALKGNNDHVLEINQTDQTNSPLSRESLSYLQHLPPIVEFENAIFAHSLPFIQQLGLSCMTKAMGEAEINQFFSQSDNKILFRGHNHTPQIAWQDNHKIISRTLLPKQTISLGKRIPCIVTCGALTRGLCMIWNIEKQHLTSLSFN